uniref:Small ribosomal subunit protein uS10m n=1 Tax=Lynceus sp. MCZ IZ 141354 TaxID=1930659 RepID=A0A9N6WV05_9CRUS|nr:EOG090X0GP9 [Lynceus sp. MCZ IZ 141354]
MNRLCKGVIRATSAISCSTRQNLLKPRTSLAFQLAQVHRNQPLLSTQVEQPKAAVASSSQLSNQKDEELDSLFKSIEIEVRCGEPAIIKSYEWFALTAAKHLGITVGKCWAPPRPIHERRTLLKSIHVYKKHRVQYEVRTYSRFMTFLNLTGSTADTFLEYIERNLPEGVAMIVTRRKLCPLPDPIQKMFVNDANKSHM